MPSRKDLFHTPPQQVPAGTVLPSPPEEYDHRNETAFRRHVLMLLDQVLQRGTSAVGSSLSATEDDFGTGAATYLTLTPAAGGTTITGFTDGHPGRALTITNASSSDNIIFAHESTSSTAANRLKAPIGSNVVLGPGRTITIHYDSDAARWRMADLDSRANVRLTLSATPAGTVTAYPVGDEDTVDMYLTAANGSTPSDPTTADTHVSGNSGSAAVLTGASIGDEVTVKAGGVNGSGDFGPIISAAITIPSAADGTVKTFAQASSPTASETGDLWIDTDDNNTLYRWNGSSWVSVKDETYAEASAQNLCGPNAGPEQSGTGVVAFEYFKESTVGGGTSIPISSLGLDVGDVLSMSAYMKTDGTTPNARLDIIFYDSGGSNTGSGSTYNVQTSTYQRAAREGLVIPASTTHIRLFLRRNSATAGTVYAKRVMLNRGPKALPYTDPPSRTGRGLPDFPAVSNPNLGGLIQGSNPLSASNNGSDLVTISCASFTMQIGSTSVDYNSSSQGPGGIGHDQEYYVYLDDPYLEGGSKQISVTQNPYEIVADDGRVYVGKIHTPTSGGGGTIGSGGGGGQY